MKKLILLTTLVLAGLSYKKADAQIGIHVNLHFGTPVVQETAQVADDYGDDYYYMPDVDAYYSVLEQCYYYNDGDEWVSAAYLPGYPNYDWRRARRFEIRAEQPYIRNDYYCSKFGGQARIWGGERAERYENRGWDRGGEYRQPYGNRGWGRGRDENENHDWNQQRGGWQQGDQYNHDEQEHNHTWGGQPTQNYPGQGRNWGGGNRGAWGGEQHFTQNRMNSFQRPARF